MAAIKFLIVDDPIMLRALSRVAAAAQLSMPNREQAIFNNSGIPTIAA
ncbi:MAG: hypothetical protein ABI395_10130 [Sphingobium sp.]